MSYARTFCRAAVGVDAPLVTVETHLANGLPAFAIVGLPEKAVQEARDRVRSALVTSGFDFPARRITVNLAPADLPKLGSRFDLAIAIGILIANGQIPKDSAGHELLGELSLAGEIRPVSGTLPAALAAGARHGRLITSRENAGEAALVQGLSVYPADHLLAVTAHLRGDKPLPVQIEDPAEHRTTLQVSDLSDIHGQPQARRALEIAAAGRHNLLMMGPPGSGKSMLASRLPGILPPMSEQEALQSAAIRSVVGQPLDLKTWRNRPFRHPHHTASGVALVGGGSQPRPGEISLAHHGVLFLDELPEFAANVLEVLREPIETGRILISRAARQTEFPADFQLVAAMNPCQCGFAGDPRMACARCSPEHAARYQRRISGPLRDRIDIQIEVAALSRDQLVDGLRQPGEPSAAVAGRVAAAWARQRARQGTSNARLAQDDLRTHCALSREGTRLLGAAIDRLGLSARGFHRILRVARSIADLADADAITLEHLTEAIGYRRLDRMGG